MDNKTKLGMLGSGMANKAAKLALENKKKKKSKLDEIMSGITTGRKAKQ